MTEEEQWRRQMEGRVAKLEAERSTATTIGRFVLWTLGLIISAAVAFVTIFER